MSTSFPSTESTTDRMLVADIDFLTGHLAVGGDLHHDPEIAIHQVSFLDSIGIIDIIDCRQEWSDEDVVAHASTIRYHHLPTDDHGGQLAGDWWDEGIAIARASLAPGGRAFVHCHMGVNRGPSLALAILIDRGMDPVEAFRLLRARRPQAFAIYAPQFLRHRGLDDLELELAMYSEFDDDDLRATIGRIRQAEQFGYRLPLA